jgi:hypothetical protein
MGISSDASPAALGPYAIEADWPLFVKKCAFVAALSYALVPLIAYKQEIPVRLFAGGLIVLHVLILVVYLWRVQIRQLDPDWRAFGARIVGLGFAFWLLELATKLEGGKDVPRLCANMLVLCAVHCVVLALLTVRVVRARPPVGLPTEPLVGAADVPLALSDQCAQRGAGEPECPAYSADDAPVACAPAACEEDGRGRGHGHSAV